METTDKNEVTRRQFLTWIAAAGAALVAFPGSGSIARGAAPSWAFANLDLPSVDFPANSTIVIPDPPPPIVNPPGVVTPPASPVRRRLSAYTSYSPQNTSVPATPASAPATANMNMAMNEYQTVTASYQSPSYTQAALQTPTPVEAAPAQVQYAPLSKPRLSAARTTSASTQVRTVAAPAGGKVTALSRKMWANVAANPAKMRPMGQVRRITIHHEGSEKPNNDVMPFDVVETLRLIHGQHRKRMGAGDIGYHFVIDRTGLIWQGRDWSYQGAHSSGANANNLGVMLLGNFEIQRPTQQQLDSLHRLVASLVRKFGLNPSSDIYGHGDLCKTQCPGTNLRPQLAILRQMK